MSVSPEVALKKFAKEDLRYIAEYRSLPVGAQLKDDPKADLVKLIAEDISSSGLQLVMSSLSKETLNDLATHCKLEYPGYDSKVKPSTKLIGKRLMVQMVEQGAKSWLLSNEAYLPAIVEDLELKVSAKDKEKAAKAILAEADEVGLENCFSAFSVERLIGFAEGSKLKIYGQEKILNALVTREAMTKPEVKKKAKPAKPSKEKPAIKKGITSVDLNSWYYRDDLAEWCEKKNLPKNGSKKDLVKRILDHLAGKDVTPKPKAKPAPKKKETAPKGKGTKRKAESEPEEGSKTKKSKGGQ